MQRFVLFLRCETSTGIAEAMVRASGAREVVGVPRLDSAHKLIAVAVGEWTVVHVVELVPAVATGANWVTGTSCGDECGPGGPSRAAAVRVGPAVVLGMPPCHLEIGGRRGDLPWLPVNAGVSVHPQEYLRRLEALFDCLLLLVHALFQSVQVLPPLALLAHLFLQGNAPVEHLQPLVGDAPQSVHLSLHAEVP